MSAGRRYRIYLLAIFALALALRWWAAGDPFLHDWNERFHALVAKNMMVHPFKPMLRLNPVLDYDHLAWCCNHIWLHRPPLFLWQMALSMKLFGVNEIAMRLPSILMGASIVFPIYRIGKLVSNPEISLTAAALYAGSAFSIEMAAGVIGLDHNDVATMFYVIASIWLFFEYLHRNHSLAIAVAIGIAAGFAVLNKYTVGMTVFSGWIFYLFLQNKQERRRNIKGLVLAIVVALLVSAPWIMYTSIAFPLEAQNGLQNHMSQLWSVIDNHEGKWHYYLSRLRLHYGLGSAVLIIFGIIVLLQKERQKAKCLTLLFYIGFIYFIYSIVETKLVSNVFVIGPLIFIVIAAAVDFLRQILLEKTNRKYVGLSVASILLATAFLWQLRPATLLNNHVYWSADNLIDFSRHAEKAANAEIYRKLNELTPEGYTILNGKDFEDIDAMFYSDRNIRHWWITQQELMELKGRGIELAIFKNHGNQNYPDYLRNDPAIIEIKETLK